MKELKVGEEIRIRCVRDTTIQNQCNRCVFGELSVMYPLQGCYKLCEPSNREDMNLVHFEIVEN